MVKCCGEVLRRSVVGKCCEGVLWKSVSQVTKCCEGPKECCGEVLWGSVVAKSCWRECWREVL